MGEDSAWGFFMRLAGAGELACRVDGIIACYADADTGEAWPAIETIAFHCRVTPRRGTEALRKLKACAVLTTATQRMRDANLDLAQPGRRRKTSPLYVLRRVAPRMMESIIRHVTLLISVSRVTESIDPSGCSCWCCTTGDGIRSLGASSMWYGTYHELTIVNTGGGRYILLKTSLTIFQAHRACAASTVPQAEPLNHDERMLGKPVQSRTQKEQRHPTYRQSELRECSWQMHCDEVSVRHIAAQVQINKETVSLYIRAERTKRADDTTPTQRLARRKPSASIRASNGGYCGCTTRSHTLETISEVTDYEGQVRIQEHYPMDATKAQERIEKIEGLDAPLKMDGTLRALSEALLFLKTSSQWVKLMTGVEVAFRLFERKLAFAAKRGEIRTGRGRARGARALIKAAAE